MCVLWHLCLAISYRSSDARRKFRGYGQLFFCSLAWAAWFVSMVTGISAKAAVYQPLILWLSPLHFAGALSENSLVEEGRKKRPSAASAVRLVKTGARKV